jgi:hypothetical protein
MGKVIILEGPDGGGKTTLANELVKRGFHYRHEGPPPEGVDLIAYYLKILNDSIESPQDTVHDRLWLGEMVYGPIFRGVDRLGKEGLEKFIEIHNSNPIYQFICMPSRDALKKNYAIKMLDSSDYVKGFDNLWRIYDKYWELMPYVPCSVFNYMDHKVEWLLNEVEKGALNG